MGKKGFTLMSTSLKGNQKGFTLIELLVTISIIAVLSIIGMTLYTEVQKKARDAKRIGDTDSVSKAYESRYNQNGDGMYPVPLTGWFESGFPFDPLNTTTYYYSWTGGSNANARPTAAATSFTICAKLEKGTGGNATDYNFTTVTPGQGGYYCKKSLQ